MDTTNMTASIEKRMSDIYTMFCMPCIFLDTNTGEIEITYKWENSEAEKAYESLRELLHYHYKRLRENPSAIV